MKRRSFIKAGALTGVPMLINGFTVTAAEYLNDEALNTLLAGTLGCGKVLVIIQQNGGNDGLNTIIPIDKYSILSNVRANILIPESAALSLNSNPTTKLNPAMREMQNLYNQGKMCIVQGVSYPNPNFSHFRATDIWFSASNSNQVLDTGWLGRSLDAQYPNYPTGYPNNTMPDPLAIQIGSTLPFSLQGARGNMGYNVPNPQSLLNVINATTDPAPNNDYGRELTYMRLMKDQSNAYRTVIQNAYNAQATLSSQYPTSGNSLADQLKIVARLIGGGLQTPIYIVNHPFSHDTHADQVSATDTTVGTQANNLSILSKAIAAFQDDIERMGKADNVCGMTFSEFGRRIISNASRGTDHGSAAPVLFFGTKVAGGMIGASPNLPAAPTVNDQVPMQHDFRQLYSTIIQQWFCMSQTDATTVLGNNFSTVPIFSTTGPGTDDIVLVGQYLNGKAQLSWQLYANKLYQYFDVEYSTDGVNYAKVGTLGNTTLADNVQYSFEHTIAAPTMYYRIKGSKWAGTTKYSNEIKLYSGRPGQLISVAPNPVHNYQLNVRLLSPATTEVDITIYDMIGSKIYYNKFKAVNSLISFRVPPAFVAHAHYILEARFDGQVAREQIMFE